MRAQVEDLITNTQEMVCFYYDEQGGGRRFDIQYMLFIVYHSYVDSCRGFYLICVREGKRIVYRTFLGKMVKMKFLNIIMFCYSLSLLLNENWCCEL